MKTTFVLALLISISTPVDAQRMEYTFTNKDDMTQNYYLTVFPEGEIRGALILLSGFGEVPIQSVGETDIHKYASQAGLLTIIPLLGDRLFFYIDNTSHQKLNQHIEDIFRKYNLEGKPFFIGGHSFGGTMAMQYAERAWVENSNLRHPTAVFALDPPLDIERLYNCMTTSNRPPKNPISVDEDKYISGRIQQEFKTNPKDDPQFFWKVSPFAHSDPAHSSLTPLRNVPLRVYNDPDINWYIENRSVDYYCVNVLDSAAMVNWLRSMGNNKAELVVATGKGFRAKQNIRHPHSWSIADGKELVAWMMKQ